MNVRKTFDELAIAKEMESNTVNNFTKTSALIYAKYLRYKAICDLGKDYNSVTVEDMEQLDSQIEKELIAFCERTVPEFNYVKAFLVIDQVVEWSKKYKLKLPHPIPITQLEWDAIMSIDLSLIHI